MKWFLKKGAEIILGIMAVPLLGWATWVTVGIFSSQKVEAVQEAKYQVILESLHEIKVNMGIAK